jgi:hypothetical protein
MGEWDAVSVSDKTAQHFLFRGVGDTEQPPPPNRLSLMAGEISPLSRIPGRSRRRKAFSAAGTR